MAENNSSATLLPCPFCGASARGYEIEPHQHSAALLALVPDMPKEHHGSYVIEGNCQCGAGLIGDNQAEVTARWNTRAPQAVAAQAAPAAVAVPEGWKLVPLQDTPKMWTAGGQAIKSCGGHDRDEASLAYKAMLEAAPTPALPATEDSSAGDLATESVLIEGVAYTIPEAVALELLRLNIELQLAEVQAEPVAGKHAAWSEGFNAGCKWREDVTEFWQRNDYGSSPKQPANPYPATAPQAQPADALLLDYLQATGSTVEIIPGPTGWNFRVGGLHASVRSDLRSSIDAAMAAAQEGGNAAKEA